LISKATALLLSDGQMSRELMPINKGLLDNVKYSADVWRSLSLLHPPFIILLVKPKINIVRHSIYGVLIRVQVFLVSHKTSSSKYPLSSGKQA